MQAWHLQFGNIGQIDALARQIKAHVLVAEVVGSRTRNFAPHGLHLDVIELRFVIGKAEVCGQRFDGTAVGLRCRQREMSRTVWIRFRSGSLQGEIQSTGHGIIHPSGALQFRNVGMANGCLHLERQVLGETSFLQRRRTIHIQVRATFLNDAVMHGHAGGRVLHVPGKLIDVNASRLCSGLRRRWLWRRGKVEQRLLFRRRLGCGRRRFLHTRGIDVGEVRCLHVAGDLRILQPAGEGSVEACPAREFHAVAAGCPWPSAAAGTQSGWWYSGLRA